MKMKSKVWLVNSFQTIKGQVQQLTIDAFLDSTFIRELKVTKREVRREAQAYLKKKRDLNSIAKRHCLCYNNIRIPLID